MSNFIIIHSKNRYEEFPINFRGLSAIFCSIKLLIVLYFLMNKIYNIIMYFHYAIIYIFRRLSRSIYIFLLSSQIRLFEHK